MSESLIFAHFLFFGERCEQFAHNRSFLDKKQAIRSEIKWANSQPCKNVPYHSTLRYSTFYQIWGTGPVTLYQDIPARMSIYCSTNLQVYSVPEALKKFTVYQQIKKFTVHQGHWKKL